MEDIELRYLGNKTRLSKELTPLLTKHLTGENWYVEPFAGAFGMISNIHYSKRIAYDNDKYIIELMKAVRNGWSPPETLTETEYINLKTLASNGHVEPLIAFAGYGCSFGGKWFNGFARGGKTSRGEDRNHVAESARNLNKMRDKLQGIKIRLFDYKDAPLGVSNVIYADPLYVNCTKYKMKFNHEEFWEWCRNVAQNNFLYVSEYTAPSDFISIWSKEHKTGIHHGFKEHKQSTENLFVYSKTFAKEIREGN